MNPLAALKEKMMIKPNVEERERVAIVIKGVKQPKKTAAEKKPRPDNSTVVKAPKLVLEADEETAIEEEAVKEAEKKQKVEAKTAGPVIIDATEKGFDREALLKKMAESQKLKVTFKPTVEAAEVKATIPVLPEPVKKPVKVSKIVLEAEEGEEKPLEEEKPLGEEEEETYVMKPKKKVQIVEPKKEEEPGEEEKEEVYVMKPKKKDRTTKKV